MSKQSEKKYVKPDFVQEYVLTDPKKLFINYECFFGLPKMPVSVGEANESGFHDYIDVPGDPNIFMYLAQLTYGPREWVENPKNRTLTVVNLTPKNRVFIFPNQERPKVPFVVVEEGYKRGSWVMHVTPEINRAIVEQLKTFTR